MLSCAPSLSSFVLLKEYLQEAQGGSKYAMGTFEILIWQNYSGWSTGRMEQLSIIFWGFFFLTPTVFVRYLCCCLSMDYAPVPQISNGQISLLNTELMYHRAREVYNSMPCITQCCRLLCNTLYFL